MKEAVALGLDVGTSGLKAIALNAAGERVAEAGASYPLLTPRPGWTEQHPADWVNAARTALSELAGQLSNHEVVALGLSGQMHGLVPLDAGGEVIRPAPLWNDQRTGAAVLEIEARVPRGELIARTGNPAVTGFQLPKILWLRQAEPEHFARLRHALLPKDYLGYVLSGELATEPSDASGVGALNLAARDWDADILAALDLDPALFPPVAPSHTVVGRLKAEWARQTGLPAGLPVVAGAGDNAGAAVGLGLSSQRLGVGSLSLGTSGVIFLPLDAPTPESRGRVHLFCHADGGYHLLGVTLSAAGALQWFRDALAPEVSFDALLAEAGAAPPGAHGLTFVPYLAGERSPHLNPEARGVFAGLSLLHGRPELVRAILEGAAFALEETLDAMRPLTKVEELLTTGGGARSALWTRIVGAALNVPLARPRIEGSPARGAAILAQVGAGVYGDVGAAIQATAPTAEPLVAGEAGDYAAAKERYRAASAWALAGARPGEPL